MKHGRWPDSLNELVPHFLNAVPRDTFSGDYLKWHQMDNGVVVYSVGANRQDDGGDLESGEAGQPDIGFRLWDVAKRRQPPPDESPFREPIE